MLTSLDYYIVFFYALLVGALGIYAKKLVKNPQDYFAGGKKVPWWLAAISHHVSGYSAFAFVGLASLGYSAGYSAWTFMAPPIFLAMVLGSFLWAPRWSKMNILTPIQFLEQRYNNTVRQVFAWSGIGIKFVDEGVKLYSLAIIVHVVTGWPLPELIIVCGIVTIAYLFLGGLWATMLTDALQFLIQFSITILMVPFILKLVGGFRGLHAQMPANQTGLFSEHVTPVFLFVYTFVVILSYNGGTWGLAQRFYSIGKPSQARKAALLSAFLYLIYPLAIFIPMWAGHSLLGKVDNAEHVYILVAQKVLPQISPGLLGLLIASMFAATMSMIDTDINALSAVFTKDIFQRTIKKNANDKLLLRVGMASTVVLGAITISTALMTIRMEGAFKAMIQWYAAILAPVSLPLLLGMLIRRPTWRGALAAWFFGFLTFVLFKFGWPVVTGLPASFALYTGAELVVTFLVFIGEGYITRKTPEEKAQIDAFFEQFDHLD